MSDTKTKTLTIQLDEAITVKGETYTSLTFRKAKAKDLAQMDLVKGNVTKHMALLSSMAGVSLPVIEELDMEDYTKISTETAPLLGNSVASALPTAPTATEPASAE